MQVKDDSPLAVFTRRVKFIARFGIACGQVIVNNGRMSVGINGFLFRGTFDGSTFNVTRVDRNPDSGCIPVHVEMPAFALDISGDPIESAEKLATIAGNLIP